MSEEAIARALASNEDFARKVADLIADKIVIKKIDELTKEVEKLSKTMQDLVDQQKLVGKNLRKMIRSSIKLWRKLIRQLRR
jgi:ribosomal protein S13